MTRPELDWFYGGGAGKFWPEQWKKFTDPIPQDEHQDLIAAYNKRLFVATYQWKQSMAKVGQTGKMP